jgi:hypothetical protein
VREDELLREALFFLDDDFLLADFLLDDFLLADFFAAIAFSRENDNALVAIDVPVFERITCLTRYTSMLGARRSLHRGSDDEREEPRHE